MSNDYLDSPPDREFRVTAIQTLTKYDISVITNDYEEYYLGRDEDGNDNVEFDVEVRDPYFNQHLKPIDIIEECSDLAKKMLKITENSAEKEYLSWVIEECANWEVSDTEVIKD